MTEQPSSATEDYLKRIYELSLDETPVKTSRLADAMDVSPAAVTEMLKRLDERTLVRYRPYRGVALTDEGRRRALRVLRRHRLWELFLAQVLGVPWERVHDYACRFEHATDEALSEALDRFLGRPDFDPHGDPIPSADLAIVEIDRLPLATLAAGDQAVITQCADEAPALLDYLGGLGLVPGARVAVLECAPFNGPLTLRVGDADRVIGREVAQTLFVRRAAAAGEEDPP